MHDARHAAAGVGADGQHEAAVADRVVGVREVGGEIGASQLALDAGLELTAQPGLVPARRCEGGRRFVAELAALVETADEARDELRPGLEWIGQIRQGGELAAAGSEETRAGKDRLQARADVEELGGLEQPAFLGPDEAGGDVGAAAQLGRGVAVEQRPGLAGLAQAGVDARFVGFEEGQALVQGQTLQALRGPATVRQGGHQACPFEALEGGTGNGKGHAGSLRAGFGPRRTAGRTAAFKLPMGGPKRNRWRRDVRQRRPSSARVRSMR